MSLPAEHRPDRGQCEVKPTTRADWAYLKLRRVLLAGEFEPGDRLSPRDLAERWGVSATPLREAFSRLVAEGHLEQVPQRGVRVAPISLQEFAEIYELRLLLEPGALGRSISQGDDRWLQGVERTWDELRHVIDNPRPDPLLFEEAHNEFHDALFAACGSQWMLRTIRGLGQHANRFRLLTGARRGGFTGVLHEHHELFEAATARDVDRAVTGHVDHLLVTVAAVDPELVGRLAPSVST